MPSNESNISCTTEPVWPAWTDLVVGSKGLKLMDQVIELQGLLRQTIVIVEEQFIFENSYPGLIEHNRWNRRAIQQACEAISGPSARVKAKYQIIAECTEADHEYLKEISSLVSHLSGRIIVEIIPLIIMIV